MLEPGRLKRALLIFAAASCVRLVWTFANSDGAFEVRGDATFFFESAQNLLHRGVFADDHGNRALRLPLYPAFLAGIFAFAGPSVAATQAVQSILGGVTCALLYLGAAAWLSEEAALFAGWSAVFYYGLIFPCGRILAESFYVFWLTLLFTAWFWDWGTLTAAVSSACAVALYLTRPEGIFAPLGLAALGPFLRFNWRWRHSILLVAALASAMGAWGLRNKAALGHFTPGTTGAGFSFWAGLPRTASGALSANPTFLISDPSLGEEEKDRFYWKAGFDGFRRMGPRQIFRTAAFNLAGAYYPFLPQYEATYIFLLPLWLFAFWALRERRELWPVFLLIVGWSALYVVFGGHDSRFRQFLAPLLIWLSAGAYERLRATVSARRLARAAAGWLATNAVVFAFAPYFRLAALAVRDMIWRVR